MTFFDIHVPGYELVEKIGSGGMATVWKARQQSLDRLVAIKLLPMASIQGVDAAERFRMETHIAARLRHPGIVQVYDAGETGGVAYLIMELVEGYTVGDRIRTKGRLEEGMALKVGLGVAQALAYAWEKECLIHCDVKPDNMLVEASSGTVKVSDLGLARLIGPKALRPEQALIIGTPNYLSPEQARGDSDLDCRTDMYALGASLYHMVTGVLPFGEHAPGEAMERHIFDTLPDPCEVNEEVSEGMGWLIEGLMGKDRTKRPAFWSQVVKDLEGVAEGRFPQRLPEEGESTVQRGLRRMRRVTPEAPAKGTRAGVARPKIVVREQDLAKRMGGAKPPVYKAGDAVGGLAAAVALAGVVYAGVFWFAGRERAAMEKRSEVVTEQAAPVPFLVDEDFEDVVPASEVAEEARAAPGRMGDSQRMEVAAARLGEGRELFNEWIRTREHPEGLGRVEALARSVVELVEKEKATGGGGAKAEGLMRDAYRLIADVRGSLPVGVIPVEVWLEDVEEGEGSERVVAVQEEVYEADPGLGLARGWSKLRGVDEGLAEDWETVLLPYVTGVAELGVEERPGLIGGVLYLDGLEEAARKLNGRVGSRGEAGEGFRGGSIEWVALEGGGRGVFEEVWAGTDRKDQVVFLHFVGRQGGAARLDGKEFSAEWQGLDLVLGVEKPRKEMKVARRVRLQDEVLRIESEALGGRNEVEYRTLTILPRHFGAVMLYGLEGR